MPFTTGDHCAAVGLAALEKGRSGAQYQALCRDEDTCTLPDFCNLGCEIAGVSHRVVNVSLETGGKEIGVMTNYAERTKFRVDTSATERELGVYSPPLKEGVRETIDWLRAVGKLN
jgi:nucleoside-diphosphate-sugar epimerase